MVAAALIAGWLAVATAQPVPAPSWVGNTLEFEAHLRNAEIVRLEDIGTGVTRPRRAYLNPALPFESLTWKVLPPGRRTGYWESYKSEIAAYELDKLLGMNMIPPAVERKIGDETGAAIVWVPGMKSVRQLGNKVPSGAAWARPLRKMLTFDNFIANIDRNAGNMLIGAPGELILIDHSRAFTTTEQMVKKIERVDAELWGKIQALTRQDLDRALGPWLDDGAISAMLARRARMDTAIEKLVKKKGRSIVVVQ